MVSAVVPHSPSLLIGGPPNRLTRSLEVVDRLPVVLVYLAVVAIQLAVSFAGVFAAANPALVAVPLLIVTTTFAPAMEEFGRWSIYRGAVRHSPTARALRRVWLYGALLVVVELGIALASVGRVADQQAMASMLLITAALRVPGTLVHVGATWAVLRFSRRGERRVTAGELRLPAALTVLHCIANMVIVFGTAAVAR